MTITQKHHVSTADGTRLFVQDTGAGPPLLLIPGLGFATWSFTKQVKQLSSVARVITMDNRGAGRSDKPGGPYSIGQLADDAHTVLTQLDAAPAHIVGTSMGGYIGLTLALQHPEAVRSLTLIATTSGGPGSHGVQEDTLRAWRTAAPLGAAGFARATMQLSFAPGWVDEHPDEYEHLLAQRLVAPTPPEAWRAQFAACAAYLTRGAPSGLVTVPTTIIHGTADRIVPYANAIHTAHRIPHARFVTLQDAGHLCWIEAAASVNNLITAQIIPVGTTGTR
jgi:pimeloyl-ACP methyl ester carboxylesterase